MTMFIRNNGQQFSLTDPLINMPKYLKDILKKSWADTFREYIFPNINEEPFAVLYSDNPASRPNSPVNVIIGLLILKEIFNLTDEELIGSIYFDIRYQYALGTTSYCKQPVSINTLYNFRKRLYEYEGKTGIDLIKQEVENLAKLIAKHLKVDNEKIRMDSLMVSSSCKKLSRIELVYSVNARFVKMLKKTDETLIPEECLVYLEKGHKNETIYKTRDKETQSKLQFLIEHSQILYNSSKNEGEAITDTEEFQLLSRMLNEQLNKDDKGNTILKPGNEISPESLQNPTDPDATYRKKYKDNTGYVANVVEAFNDENSVIIDYDLKPNTYSDSKFADDVIEKLADDQDNKDIKLITDGGYYSQEKAEEASSEGIDMMPGELVGRKPSENIISYAEFDINKDTNLVEKCPAGEVPVESYYNEENETYTAKFEKEQCNNCPHHENCPMKEQAKHNVVRFNKKRYKTDLQRQRMLEPEYIELTNKRAGVEGIPSVLRRKYDVDYMPVRGSVRSKFWFGFKIAAFNVKQLFKGVALLDRASFSHLYAYLIYILYPVSYILFSKDKRILV